MIVERDILYVDGHGGNKTSSSSLPKANCKKLLVKRCEDTMITCDKKQTNQIRYDEKR